MDRPVHWIILLVHQAKIGNVKGSAGIKKRLAKGWKLTCDHICLQMVFLCVFAFVSLVGHRVEVPVDDVSEISKLNLDFDIFLVALAHFCRRS